MPWGVGVIGAGPGVSALHLPTLARVRDRFEVVHVSDAGSGRARQLAESLGASHSHGVVDLLADPRVEVVAICSPPEEHAAQIRAAVEAGVRAILCEKPLATTAEDAEASVRACREAGVGLLVGTNHLFDPAWGRATHHLIARRARVQTVSITVALPPNGRYHALVTEFEQARGSHPRLDHDDPEVAGAIVRRLMIGLGIHDLPIVRDLAPDFDRILYARPVAPIGYAVGFVSSGVLVQMNAVMLGGGADALWRIAVGTDADELEVEFRPAFTHDGSALVRVRSPGGRTVEYPREPSDGYIAEWEALSALIDGVQAVEYDALLEDAVYAVAVADAAGAAAREGMLS